MMNLLKAAFSASALGIILLGGATQSASARCTLNSPGGQIKQVINIVFDNVHLRRDNPNVPSDLEQMPNLLNFLQNYGTVSGNHHTPLISHTAHDIVTTLTGVYGDRNGIPVANSYGFFNPPDASHPNGSVSFSSSFLYWTALGGDGKPQMINEQGKTAPAPWVPYTRAGCDVGAYSVANIEFETIPGDIITVFGANSTQATNVNTILSQNPNDNNFNHQKARQELNADYLGIAIHCAQNSPLCSGATGAPDVLPQEPNGYNGFRALYGNISVAPAICTTASNPAACDAHSATGNVRDVFGSTVIANGFGHPGFPNIFSPTAAQSLGYAAAMLESGVQVIYVYIADAHDRNPLPVDPNTGRFAPAHAFGPGEQEYVNQLKAYDQAFGAFFARLAADGITKDNTLFTVVPDENDHFVGGAPTPANCDGVSPPCNYAKIGEIEVSLDKLLLQQRSNSTPFLVHSDSAPTVYIVGNPAPTDTVTRTMEQDLDALVTTNPITGNTDKLSKLLADQAEMKLLHMVTTSPARTPTLTMFGDENYFFETGNNTGCATPTDIVCEAPGFAWNHGDFQKDITRTWVAVVGPGVQQLGRNDEVFTDHADVRPTIMALLGLKDDYVHEGRVVAEWMHEKALPDGIQDRREGFIELAQIYKQLNAPLGKLGRASLVWSNRSVTGTDKTYARYLKQISEITAERDQLASQIKTALSNAEFHNQPVGEGAEDGLGNRAKALIDKVEDLAGRDRDLQD